MRALPPERERERERERKCCVWLCVQVGWTGVLASHSAMGGLGLCLLPARADTQEEKDLLRSWTISFV